jgi:hypothetical protein
MSEDAHPATPEIPADPTAALPDDTAILRQMVLELLAALRDTRRQNEELQHRLRAGGAGGLGPGQRGPTRARTGGGAQEEATPSRAKGLAQESSPRASRLRVDRGRTPLPGVW